MLLDAAELSPESPGICFPRSLAGLGRPSWPGIYPNAFVPETGAGFRLNDGVAAPMEDGPDGFDGGAPKVFVGAYPLLADGYVWPQP